MLQLLPRYPGSKSVRILKEELAQEGFVTTERTIQRDLNTLSEIFPITADEDLKPYRWSWATGAKALEIPSMGANEALTFRLAEAFLKELLPRTTLKYLEPHFQRAREVLKKSTVSGLKDWHKKVRIIPRGQQLLPAKIATKVLDVVYEALLRGHRFSATYHPRDTEYAKEYEVSPLGLVFRHGIIYLVCTLWNYQDIVQLAMHRIGTANLLNEKVKRPKDFDLETYVSSGAFGYPVTDEKIRLQALFDEKTGWHLYETPLSEDQQLTPKMDGRILVKATVRNTEELRWWLLAFGNNVEVLAPAALRKEIMQALREASSKYK